MFDSINWLENTKPIPSSNEKSTSQKLHELLYIKKFYDFYNDINNHIEKFLNSPDEIKRAFGLTNVSLPTKPSRVVQ